MARLISKSIAWLPAALLGVVVTSLVAIPSGNAQVPSDTTRFDPQFTPLPGLRNRYTYGERLQMDVLEKLPARSFIDANVETSFRLETNPFQFPTKRALRRQLPPPDIFAQLDPVTQFQLLDQFKFINSESVVFRVIPNVQAGFLITPRTRVFANYFFIRDKFFRNNQLSTVSHSVAGGIRNDLPFKRRFNLTSEFQFRELFVKGQQPLFDFLPSATLSCALTPRTSIFANTLLQLRGTRYFQAPTKEIDPFYTVGFSHSRGQWLFTGSGLLVTNYRSPFLSQASQRNQDPFAWILDFEVSHPVTKRIPSMRAFVRSENIFNFNTHNTPGSAGSDYRLFWGLKMAVGKQPTYPFIEDIRKQLAAKESGTAQ